MSFNGSGSFNSADAGSSRVVTIGSISLSGADAGNYNLRTNSATATAAITPRVLSVSRLSAENKTYDATTTATITAPADFNAADFGNLVDGEDLSFSISQAGPGAVFADANVGAAKALTLTGVSLGDTATGKASNYTLVGVGGLSATITPKVLDLSGSRVYDGTTNVASSALTLSGLVGSETLALHGAGTIADKAVARDANNQVIARSLGLGSLSLADGGSGDLASNYTLAGGDHSVTINVRNLTAAYSADDKVYDQTPEATVRVSAAELISGDDLNIEHTSASFSDKNAGTGKLVTISGISLSGADASNYSLTNSGATATATASITPRPITVSGLEATSRAYDGTTAVAITGTLDASAAALSGDTLTISGNANVGRFNDANVGTAKAVNLTGLTLGGADAGNYTTSGVSGLSADVTPYLITLSGERVYDGDTAVAAQHINLGTLVGADSLSLSGAGAMADKNVANGKALSLGSLQLGDGTGRASNYAFAASGHTVDITAKELRLAYSAADKTYDGFASADVSVSAPDLVAGDLVSFGTPTAAFATADAGTNKLVTISGFSLSGSDAGNYILTNSVDNASQQFTATTTATITPRPLSVSGLSAESRVYDGSTAVALTSSGSVSFGNLVGNETLGFSLPGTIQAEFADANAGTAKAITLTNVGLSDGSNGGKASNYTLNGVLGLSADITPKQLNLSGSRVYDATTVVNAADLSLQGLMGADSLSLSGAGAMADKNVASGKTLSLGSLQLGDGTGLASNYAFAATGHTVTITAKGVMAQFNAADKVYDRSTTAQVAGSATFLGDDVVSVSFGSAAFADANAGSGKLVTISGVGLSGADAANYSLLNPFDNTSQSFTASTSATITPRPLSVSGLSAANRPYDGTTAVAISGSADFSGSVLSGDVVTIQQAQVGGEFADKNAGTNKAINLTGVTLSGADAGNYTTNGVSDLTASITPFVVSLSGMRTYNAGTTVAAGDLYLPALVGSESLSLSGSGSVASTGVGFGKPVNVGTLTLKSAGSGNTSGDAANYTLQGGDHRLTITPKLISLTNGFSASDRAYDGSISATASVTQAATGQIFSGDQVSFAIGSASFADKNVGSGKQVAIRDIQLTGASAANYALASTASTTSAAISAKALTVTGLSAASRVYDGGTQVAISGNASFSGVVNGDDLQILSDAATLGAVFGDRNAGTAKAINLTGVTLSGTDASNYTVQGVQGLTASITPRQLNLSASRIYDGSTAVDSSLFTDHQNQLNHLNLVSGDSVTLTGSGSLASKAVGVARPFNAAGLQLGGSEGANYTLSGGSHSLTITPKALTALFTGSDKTYDGTTAATVSGSSSDLVSGDRVGFAFSAASFADKNAAAGKAITVSGIQLTGADAGNYSLTSSTATSTATIRQKSLTVIGLAAADKDYDGTTRATVIAAPDLTAGNLGLTSGDFTGVISGDNVALQIGNSVGAVFANPNVGTAKVFNLRGISLSGSDAANYSLNAIGGVEASITPRQITLSGSRAYDGSTSVDASALQITGLVSGESLQLNGAGSIASKNVARDPLTDQVVARELDAVGLSLGSAISGPGLSSNYAIANDGHTVTITPKDFTATFTTTTREYDGTWAAQVQDVSTDRVSGDDLSVSFGAASFAGRNAGANQLVTIANVALAGADAGNYQLTNSFDSATQQFSATSSGTITARRLSVSGLTAADRAYNGSTAVSLSGTISPADISGFIGTETLDIQIGIVSGDFADRNAGTAKAINLGGITLSDATDGSGGLAANYSLDGVRGLTASVTPKQLSLSGSRVYDGSTSVDASALQISGLVSGESLQLSGAGSIASKHVARDGFGNVIAQNLGLGSGATALTLQDEAGASLSSGGLASNYIFSGGTHEVTITPRSVTASFTADDKEYDRTTTAQVQASGDLIDGDDVAITHSSADFASNQASAASTVSVTGVALAGSDASNYSLQNNSATTTAAITPRRLTVAGLSAADREYDATTTVQLSGSVDSFSGVFSGDALSITMANPGQVGAVFADKNAGVQKAINLTGVNLSGADAANYTVNGVRGLSATVTPRQLVVSGLVAADKVFDGTITAQVSGTPSFSGVISGDDLGWQIGSLGASFLNANPGTNKPLSLLGVTLSGADAGNYTVRPVTGLRASILAPLAAPGGGGGGGQTPITPFLPRPPISVQPIPAAPQPTPPAPQPTPAAVPTAPVPAVAVATAAITSPVTAPTVLAATPGLVQSQIQNGANGLLPASPVNSGSPISPYPLAMAESSPSDANTGSGTGSSGTSATPGLSGGSSGSASVQEGPLQPNFRVETQRSERYRMGQGSLVVEPGQEVCLSAAGCSTSVDTGTPAAPDAPGGGLGITGVDEQASYPEPDPQGWRAGRLGRLARWLMSSR